MVKPGCPILRILGHPPNQRVTKASFHLDGKANQWLQGLQRVHKKERMVLTWDVFKKELLAQFGPMEYEDFDEVLSQIKQYGTFQEYHQE